MDAWRKFEAFIIDEDDEDGAFNENVSTNG
jgi:hypothetical protein